LDEQCWVEITAACGDDSQFSQKVWCKRGFSTRDCKDG
jgi:hypothetical protein